MSEYQPRHALPDEHETNDETFLTTADIIEALRPELDQLTDDQQEAFEAFLDVELRPDDTPQVLLEDFLDRYQGSYDHLRQWAEQFITEQQWDLTLDATADQLGMPPETVLIDREAIISHYFNDHFSLLVAYRSPGRIHVLFA